MNCQEVMELMQRHVDDDLDEQETSRMMNHVGHCPECAAMLDRLVRLSRGLEQMPRVVPPYSLVDAILPELGKWDAAAAAPAEPASMTLRSRRIERKRNAWIARLSGVVAVGVVVGLLLMNGPFNGGFGGSSRNEAESAPSAAAPSAAPSAAPAQEEMSMEFSLKTDGEGALRDKDARQDPAAEPSPRAAEPGNSKSTADSRAEPPSSGGGGSSGSEAGSMGSAGSEPSTAPAESPGEPVPADPPALDGGDEGNKGVTSTDPSEPVSNEPPASIMGVPPEEEALSPDGRWRAVISDNVLRLYDLSVDRMVYESAPDDGKRSNLVWSTDSTAVSYTLTDPEGKQTEIALLVPGAEEKE